MKTCPRDRDSFCELKLVYTWIWKPKPTQGLELILRKKFHVLLKIRFLTRDRNSFLSENSCVNVYLSRDRNSFVSENSCVNEYPTGDRNSFICEWKFICEWSLKPTQGSELPCDEWKFVFEWNSNLPEGSEVIYEGKFICESKPTRGSEVICEWTCFYEWKPKPTQGNENLNLPRGRNSHVMSENSFENEKSDLPRDRDSLLSEN